jgi:hypothetical protein
MQLARLQNSDKNMRTMKQNTPSIVLVCSVVLALSSCGSGDRTVSWNDGNPLVTSRYGDDLADTMANLIISKDPAADDPMMRPTIDKAIKDGKRIGAEARTVMNQGLQGGLIAIKEDLQGFAVYVNDTLFFSSDFEVKPGPALHVFLTRAVDPRDIQFPDATAIDLGIIQSPFGAQQYDVPHQAKADAIRTVVFWDTSLKRLYGFGQLSKR